jgi:hypothetical protein
MTGFVDDRQHFLGNGLGRGQETRAQAGNRKHRLANFSHADLPPSPARRCAAYTLLADIFTPKLKNTKYAR